MSWNVENVDVSSWNVENVDEPAKEMFISQLKRKK